MHDNSGHRIVGFGQEMKKFRPDGRNFFVLRWWLFLRTSKQAFFAVFVVVMRSHNVAFVIAAVSVPVSVSIGVTRRVSVVSIVAIAVGT